MNEVVVHDWEDLLHTLFEESWDPGLQRYRSPYAFRGMTDAAEPLETTLMRLGGDFAEVERHLLRNFRKYAHRDVVQRDSIWHWISVAQHHGLPTRLLDWTFSPFVALHFATANMAGGTDGIVWTLNFNKAHALLPDRLRAQLRRERSGVFTVEMLSKSIESLEVLDTMAPKPFLLFFEPPSIDDRIVNQYALFCIMSDPTVSLERWVLQHANLYRRIRIPAELKWEVRDKLDQANVTERVLFPGLDGLTRWLRRHYSPRP